jgi:hypothetical protein
MRVVQLPSVLCIGMFRTHARLPCQQCVTLEASTHSVELTHVSRTDSPLRPVLPGPPAASPHTHAHTPAAAQPFKQRCQPSQTTAAAMRAASVIEVPCCWLVADPLPAPAADARASSSAACATLRLKVRPAPPG